MASCNCAIEAMYIEPKQRFGCILSVLAAAIFDDGE